MNNASVVDEVDLRGLLDGLLQGPLRQMDHLEQALFRIRYELYLPDVLRPLAKLYGDRPDFVAHLENLLGIVAQAYASRPEELRLLDLRRVDEPDWFQQSRMMGYVCYADRFADNLNGVTAKIPYLKELGITYLHLMPLLKPRPGASDGGYAVMDYRAVRDPLGHHRRFARTGDRLRAEDISLCIDLVCNHTAKEHDWARKALAGDTSYQAYYHIFPDRVARPVRNDRARNLSRLRLG